MRYDVKSFKAEVEFIDESNEKIDECALRCAIERQVRVSLDLDEDVVCVSSFEVTAHEVIRCNYCEETDNTATEQRSAVWNKGTEDEQTLEHVCQKCRSQYPELEDENGKRTA